jgi:hypothetical protein
VNGASEPGIGQFRLECIVTIVAEGVIVAESVPGKCAAAVDIDRRTRLCDCVHRKVVGLLSKRDAG